MSPCLSASVFAVTTVRPSVRPSIYLFVRVSVRLFFRLSFLLLTVCPFYALFTGSIYFDALSNARGESCSPTAGRSEEHSGHFHPSTTKASQANSVNTQATTQIIRVSDLAGALSQKFQPPRAEATHATPRAAVNYIDASSKPNTLLLTAVHFTTVFCSTRASQERKSLNDAHCKTLTSAHYRRLASQL